MTKLWQELFSIGLVSILAIALPLSSLAATGDTVEVSMVTTEMEGNGYFGMWALQDVQGGCLGYQ